MTDTIIQSHQMCIDQRSNLMQWNCDEYIIWFDRRSLTLTVEDFVGFDDDGEEITSCITHKPAVMDIIRRYQPGWLGLDGFVKLEDYYLTDREFTIGNQPI